MELPTEENRSWNWADLLDCRAAKFLIQCAIQVKMDNLEGESENRVALVNSQSRSSVLRTILSAARS